MSVLQDDYDGAAVTAHYSVKFIFGWRGSRWAVKPEIACMREWVWWRGGFSFNCRRRGWRFDWAAAECKKERLRSVRSPLGDLAPNWPRARNARNYNARCICSRTAHWPLNTLDTGSAMQRMRLPIRCRCVLWPPWDCYVKLCYCFIGGCHIRKQATCATSMRSGCILYFRHCGVCLSCEGLLRSNLQMRCISQKKAHNFDWRLYCLLNNTLKTYFRKQTKNLLWKYSSFEKQNRIFWKERKFVCCYFQEHIWSTTELAGN